MMRIVVFALAILTQTPTGIAAAACNGADPAIVFVAVKGIHAEGGMNVYHLGGRVTNVGHAKQASNVLQFVGIYEDDIRRDVRSIPPLKAGASFTFTYDYQRSIDAGDGTTDLAFRLDIRRPVPPGRQDCNLGNDQSAVQF
jgi:hypothetical protein